MDSDRSAEIADVGWLLELGDAGGDKYIELGLEGEALGMMSLGSGSLAA